MNGEIHHRYRGGDSYPSRQCFRDAGHMAISDGFLCDGRGYRLPNCPRDFRDMVGVQDFEVGLSPLLLTLSAQ